MKLSLAKKLNGVANKLDSLGLTKEADYLDAISTKLVAQALLGVNEDSGSSIKALTTAPAAQTKGSGILEKNKKAQEKLNVILEIVRRPPVKVDEVITPEQKDLLKEFVGSYSRWNELFEKLDKAVIRTWERYHTSDESSLPANAQTSRQFWGSQQPEVVSKLNTFLDLSGQPPVNINNVEEQIKMLNKYELDYRNIEKLLSTLDSKIKELQSKKK